MKTLVLTDSRGANLNRHIYEYDDIDQVSVLFYRGAGLVRIASLSVDAIKQYRPDLIVLFAGICDVTERDRRTKITTMRQQDPQSTVDRVTAAMGRALEILKSVCHAKISIATMPGINFSVYNRSPAGAFIAEQETMNNSIIGINRMIVDYNRNNGAPTTWTASTLHRYYRGKYHHCYNRLSDGCHATDATLQYWAKMIVKVIRLVSPK